MTVTHWAKVSSSQQSALAHGQVVVIDSTDGGVRAFDDQKDTNDDILGVVTPKQLRQGYEVLSGLPLYIDANSIQADPYLCYDPSFTSKSNFTPADLNSDSNYVLVTLQGLVTVDLSVSPVMNSRWRIIGFYPTDNTKAYTLVR